MPVCVFEGCMSGSKKKNLIKPKNIVHLHKFPKNIELRKKWLHQIKQGSSIQDVNFIVLYFSLLYHDIVYTILL
ncbi:THAP-type domain-containing protein [Aphis craccivora]|uniref:THAP-type domain-containing protein n=1 Tax=Aphis craccivora TaxID=307492 RepID=A0A6G0Z2H0_APHCR|nr:THAP-type domain-containing protein [Aphis craccivora]